MIYSSDMCQTRLPFIRSYKPIEAHYTPAHVKVLKTIHGKVNTNFKFNQRILRELRCSPTGFLQDDVEDVIPAPSNKIPKFISSLWQSPERNLGHTKHKLQQRIIPSKTANQNSPPAGLKMPQKSFSKSATRQRPDIFAIPRGLPDIHNPRTPPGKRDYSTHGSGSSTPDFYHTSTTKSTSEPRLNVSSKRRRLGFGETDKTWPDIDPFFFDKTINSKENTQ